MLSASIVLASFQNFISDQLILLKRSLLYTTPVDSKGSGLTELSCLLMRLRVSNCGTDHDVWIYTE